MKRAWSVLAVVLLLGPLTSHAGMEREVLPPETSPRGTAVSVLSYDWKGDLLAHGAGLFVSGDGDLVVPISVLEGGVWAEVRTEAGRVYEVERVVAVDEYGGLMRVRTSEAAPEPQVVTSFGPVPGKGDVVTGPAAEGSEGQTVVLRSRVFPDLEEFCFVELSTALPTIGSPLFGGDGSLTGVVLFQWESSPDHGVLVSSDSVLLLARVQDEGVPYSDWADRNKDTWKSCFVGTCLQGMTSTWVGDFDQAIEPLQEAIEMGGGAFGEIFACLGDCYAVEGQNRNAASAYRRALSIEPSRVDLYSRLCFVLLEDGLKEEAVGMGRQAVAACPTSPDSHILLARLLNSQGEFREAADAAQKALVLDPGSAEGWLQSGIASMELGRYADAAGRLRNSLAARPGDTETLANLGYALLRGGQTFHAIVVLGHAASRACDDAETFKALGEAYAAVRLDEKAVQAYRMAISIDPGDCQAYWRLADVCIEMSDFDEALAVCSQAVSRDTQNPWLHFKMGKALCEKGDMEGAAEQVRILRRLNPGLAGQLQIRMDTSLTAGMEKKAL